MSKDRTKKCEKMMKFEGAGMLEYYESLLVANNVISNLPPASVLEVIRKRPDLVYELPDAEFQNLTCYQQLKRINSELKLSRAFYGRVIENRLRVLENADVLVEENDPMNTFLNGVELGMRKAE